MKKLDSKQHKEAPEEELKRLRKRVKQLEGKEVQGVLAKQTEDCSHIVILTKQQVLGDIVGNNHNEELPMLNIEPIKTSELALKIGKEFFKN